MDPQVLVVVPLAAPAALGLAVGRAWVLVVPFATVPIFYLGLLAGWWGAGVGDGWELGFGIMLALAFFGAAVGAGVGGLTRRR